VVWRSIGWSAGFWLTVCVGLAAVVAYQLSNSFPLAPTVTAAPPSAPPLELAERPALPRPPASDAQGLIAARPLFSEGRRPYVPPRVPVEEVAPAPSQPSLPLELAGTFLTDTDQAALLLVSGESPAWLRKGQLIGGWRIEAIEQDRVQLSKGGQQQVLQLRDDIAVSETTRPVGREVGRDNRLREVAAEPTYEDEETEDEGTEE
jgi:hypothetical protein